MQSASRFTTLSALALGIAGALAFGQADASGFQLRESSVKALGRANAGSAVSNGDASVVSLNPAAMAGLDRNTVQVDLTAIDLDADFTGGGQHLAGTPLASPVQGGNGGESTVHRVQPRSLSRTVAMAWAAIPSPRPVKPSRSVVVALTLT